MSEEIVKSDLYKEAKEAGFEMLRLVNEIVQLYNQENEKVTRGALLEVLAEDLVKALSRGYKSLGLEMITGTPSTEESAEMAGVDFILSKLVRSASNFFVIIMAYPESWEDNYLNMDLDNLGLYLEILLRKELKSGDNDGVEEVGGIPAV